MITKKNKTRLIWAYFEKKSNLLIISKKYMVIGLCLLRTKKSSKGNIYKSETISKNVLNTDIKINKK